MPSHIVSCYVDEAIAQLRRQNLMRCPGKLPLEMIESPPKTKDGWTEWKPVPSTATDAELNTIENETGLRMPPLYREFLQCKHFVTLTEYGLRFERHIMGQWSETLRKAYFHSWPREWVIDGGFLPFGSESITDAGPVCFDTRLRDEAGDCPVVFLDHEWVGGEEGIRPMFSSTRKMFECLMVVASWDKSFFHHDENVDDANELPTKRNLLKRFLSLDPGGAGGPAREYWTGWEVDPSDA